MEEVTQKIELGVNEVEVKLLNGKIKDGEYYASEIEIINDLVVDLGSSDWSTTKWSDSEAIAEETKKSLFPTRWPDTSNEDWQSPQIINTETQKWEILEAVIKTAPCVSSEIRKEVDDDYSVSSSLSGLKKDNLIAVIGYEDNKQVLVPTHVGLKEVACLYGLRFNQVYNSTLIDFIEDRKKSNKRLLSHGKEGEEDAEDIKESFRASDLKSEEEVEDEEDEDSEAEEEEQEGKDGETDSEGVNEAEN